MNKRLIDITKPITFLTFSEALNCLKEGNLLSRRGWNGEDMYIQIQNPDRDSKMTLPYIYLKTADYKFVPWVASQTDLLSDDWFIVN